MNRPYIPVAVRQRIRIRDRFRCAYCQTQIEIVGDDLQIEHILPIFAGGSSTEDNLCLACSRCNNHKATKIDGIDPHTGKRTTLFHPVKEQWSEHFSWDTTGVHLLGKTAVGRVTIVALNMNAFVICNARTRWVEAGWHPPSD